MKLKTFRTLICDLNKELFKAGLVTSTSGNVSGRDPQTELIAIKPSGVSYEALTPGDIPLVDLKGNLIEGQLQPSVDLPQHLYLYQNLPHVQGVVHTHSNYATSFAALEQSIPCYLTAMADEFGGEIPCTPYVSNEGDNIGKAILQYRGRGPAVLLGRHGVFTFDSTPQKAVKAAIMVEDVAKTVHLALLRGTPQVLPPEEIQKWWERYHSWYGQRL